MSFIAPQLKKEEPKNPPRAGGQRVGRGGTPPRSLYLFLEEKY